MRILYHHRTLADGAEGIHIDEMVSAFRNLGHDVRVTGLTASSSRSGRTGIVAALKSLLPAPAYELAAVACNPLEYRSARHVLRTFRPDLLYKRHARNDVAVLEAAREHGIESALEVNCLYGSPEYQRFEPVTFRGITARMERRALSLASVVLAVSSPLADQVRALGIDRVEVLPNAANPLSFQPTATDPRTARSRLGLPDCLTIGWAGILREWHGVDLLLEALVRIDGVVLLLIGDGPERRAVEARAKQLGLDGRVVITGRVPHHAMPGWLGAIDIGVVPDERTGVASPMKLLEYMAMGLPVVAPDRVNIRDLVTHERDGLLFRPSDAGDLASALARLAHDPHYRERLGANGRSKIERERNWTRNAEAVLRAVRADRAPLAQNSQVRGSSAFEREAKTG